MTDAKKIVQAASDMHIIGVELVKTALVMERARYGFTKSGLVVSFPVEVAGKPYLLEMKETTEEGVLQWLAEKAEKAKGGPHDDQ